MTQRRWKVGLLGAGFIIDSHAKALQTLPNVELAAVCDRARDKAEDAARTYGIRQVFTSLEEMLKSDVDVVHVLLPPDLHIDTTRRILESGRHVFLEKPMGLSSAGCQSLVDLAREKNVNLGVNHNFLFLPSYEKLRQQARDGTLGKLDQITINWLYLLGLIQFGPYNNWMLREPQNIFFELGPHLVAFALDLVGPLDSLRTEIFRPIDLPGGSRVYRRWHIHGLKGDTAVDLNLSITPGFTDRSIAVRGHAANARCDFDRDLYYRDEPSGNGILFDNFFTAQGIARQLSGNGFGNLFKSVTNTLKKAPAANPFGESIERSIKAFYDTVGGTLDPRLEGQFGVNVIAACEQITQQAPFEPAANTDQPWTVLPPAQAPTVLVLGGTGFIGRYLVKNLVDRGLSVRVVTRGMSSGNIALAGLPVELVQGELSDPAFMDRALEGIDTVFHLAKALGDKWEDYYQNDVLVTRNIAERAQARGVKRFIYTGTIDSYYSANASDVITSDTPLDPHPHRNHYARSKATCEGLLMDMHRKAGFPVIIFRPGVVIGKGCPPAHWGVGMFQSESRVQLWGDGNNMLPLVLVEDVADGLVLALDKDGLEGQTFLLTDAPLLSARDYVEAVSRESGTRLRMEPTPIWKFFVGDVIKEALKHAIKHPNRKVPSYRDWDSRSHRARYDSSKTRNVLGWKPAGTRDALIERGIVAAVRDFMR
ncbi:MAG: NAD-dependent epimerase/dehydratase family protein [Thiotrichales bacterium]